MNRKPLSVPRARIAPLSMTLALFACSEQPGRQASPPPSAATVFKDSPSPAPPPASAGTSTAPQGSPPPANTARTPEQLFSHLGCVACHGPDGIYAARLVHARGKPAEVIARRILNPERSDPGTRMPTYAGRISMEDALALANWINAGNPVIPNSQ